MRIVTYRSDRGPRAGVLVDGAVVDAWDALGGDGASVRELLEGDRLGELSGIDAGGGGRARRRRAAASGPGPGEDRLHRAQLPRARRRGRHRAAARPDDLRQVPQRAGRRPAPTVRLPAASDKVDYEAEVAFVVGRRAKEVRRGRRRSTTSPATRCSTTSPPATCSSRRRSGCRARSSTARRPAGPALVTADEAGPHDGDRLVLADPERRGDAGRLDRRPDLLHPAARRPPLAADDARAGRHRLDRDPRRASAARATRGSGSSPATRS